MAYRLTLLMLSDAEIADVFYVSVKTLCKWKTQHPEFGETIARGKLPADGEVVRSLRERALGYEWVEEMPIKVKNADKSERVEIVEVRKRVPPDTYACRFWLHNRQRARWREKHEVEHSLDNAPRVAFYLPSKGGEPEDDGGILD